MKYLAFLTLILALPLLALAQGIEEATFVPITNIPAFTEVGNAITTPDGLSAFLNNIYKLCIGAAAVLAVLQIMRAGIIYMGGDSVTEKKEAKNLIALSIGGLILVLSPVVVFSIINPEILNLEIKGIKNLETTSRLSEDARNNTLWTDTSSTREAAKSRCEAEGGTTHYTCKPASGATRTVPYGEACRAGEDGITVCRRNASTPPPGSCTAYGTPTAATGQVCTGEGMQQIERSCCAGLSDTSVCCAKRKITEELYAWKGEYYVDKACAITPGAVCQTQILRGGAYETKAQCEREFGSTTNDKSLKGSLLCSCAYNIGSQLGPFCLSDNPL